MKYIKRLRIIKEAEENVIDVDNNDSDSITELNNRMNDLKDSIDEFNMKKSKLEKVITDNTEGKDISKVIDDIINGNKFLTMYSPVVKKMLSIKKINEKIEYYKTLLGERESDLVNSKDLSDHDDRKDQEDKLKTQIDDIKSKSKDMNDKLKEMQEKVDDEQKALEEYIGNMKKKFESDLKKLKVDATSRKPL